MSRELVPVGDDLHLLDKATGETVALRDASSDLIGQMILDCDEHVRVARDAKRELGAELVRRMDFDKEWTIRAAGRKFSAPSPKPETEWNIDLLTKLLDDLVAEELISRDAALRALEPRTEWVPLARGLNALERDPALAERLALCKQSVPRTSRPVRVE